MFSFLPILQRKTLYLVIVIFCVLNIGLFYLLNFSLPQNVEVTDLTANSAVLIWNTKKGEDSKVFYSSNPFFIKLLPLTIGFVKRENDHEKTVNHRLVLSHLKPGQKYYLAIYSSGLHFYKSQRVKKVALDNRYLQITESSIPPIVTDTNTATNRPVEIKGIVINKDHQEISGSLVQAKVNNRSFSVLTDDQGRFSLMLPEITDGLIFITALNGISSQKMIALPRSLIKQPILMKLP